MQVINQTGQKLSSWTQAVREEFRDVQSRRDLTDEEKAAIKAQTKLLFEASYADPKFELRLRKDQDIVAKECVRDKYKKTLFLLNDRLAAFAAVRYMKSIGLRKRDNKELFDYLAAEGKAKIYEALIDGFDPKRGNEFSTYVVDSLKKYFRGLTRDYFREQGVSLDSAVTGDLDEESLLDRLSDKKAVRPDDNAVTNEVVAAVSKALTLLEPILAGTGENEIVFDAAQVLRLKFGLKPFDCRRHKVRGHDGTLEDIIEIGEGEFCSNPHGRKLSKEIVKRVVDQASGQLASILEQLH